MKGICKDDWLQRRCGPDANELKLNEEHVVQVVQVKLTRDFQTEFSLKHYNYLSTILKLMLLFALLVSLACAVD